jgi:hypothetical protein
MKQSHIVIMLLPFFLFVMSLEWLQAAQKPNASMEKLLADYATEAKQAEPGFERFSVEEGKKLYFMTRNHSKKGEERSCTTCHTEDPGKPGRTKVGKPIKPISPAVTSDRFTDPKKVEKWFKRNCTWVLERECTAKEKGNYITFMMSL